MALLTNPPESKLTKAHAYLDRGSSVSGKLEFEGPALIYGHIEGEIDATDVVTIGEGAVLTAQVKAASVLIAGIIKGDITATKRIEIVPSAKVTGNLTSPILIVHEGAVLDGNCSIGSGESTNRRITVLTDVTS